jgi:hypothetical protein
MVETPSDLPSEDAAMETEMARVMLDSLALMTASPAEDIQRAVDTARGLGVSWQAIGDALGIRRESAYQRFHRRT